MNKKWAPPFEIASLFRLSPPILFSSLLDICMFLIIIIIICMGEKEAALDGRRNRESAAVTAETRSQITERQQKEEKKSVGTRITDFSWRLQRPLKSPPAHFRKRKAIINIKKRRIINIVPPPCDF